MNGLPEEIRRHAPSIGEGRYRIVQVVDQNGLTHVYRAFDDRIRLFRCIRVLSPTFADDPRVREAFVEQSSQLVSFDHANVVRVVDVQPAAALPWVVTDDHWGPTVLDHLDRYGHLTPRQAVRVMRQVLVGLQALHEAGFVHADVHPRQVFLGPDGAVTLSQPSLWWVAGAALSALHEVGFTPPEQRRDPGQRSIPADLYGVGATLYALLTAHAPPDFLFEADESDKAYALVSPPFRPIVAHCCQLDPSRRPRDARVVVEALVRAGQAAGRDPVRSTPLQEPPTSLSLPIAPEFPELAPILDPPTATGPAASGSVDVTWRRTQAFEDAEEDDSADAVTMQGRPLPYQMTPVQRSERVRWEPPPERLNPDTLPGYVDRDAAVRLAEEEAEAARNREIVTPAGVSRGAPVTPVTPASAPPAPPPARPVKASRRPPRPRPARHTGEEGSSLVRWVVVGGVVGIAVALVAVLAFSTVVGSAALGISQAARATQASREQLYQTVLDHEAMIATMGDDLYHNHIAWSEVEGEPERIRAALAFLDRYALTMRVIPDTDPHRDQMADAFRRFSAARESYRRALGEWTARTETVSGRAAVAIGLGRVPPERQSLEATRRP